MNNEEKILTMLETMQGDIKGLTTKVGDLTTKVDKLTEEMEVVKEDVEFTRHVVNKIEIVHGDRCGG